MLKRKKMFAVQGLITVLICLLIFSGCNSDKGVTETTLTPPDLSTEEGIREYLVGDWQFFNEYVSDLLCDMTINENLMINLSFHDIYGGKPKGEYSGEIKFDRAYADDDEAPDLLVFELVGTDYSGGDFFFSHRTIYDEQRVMSLFFAGNGNCVFDVLGPEGYEYAPDEIMFQKITGEKSGLKTAESAEFHGVFWGMGEDQNSIWIDDVTWTSNEKNEKEKGLYPWKMTYYENDVKESVLYTIAPEMVSEILGDDLFPGTVYLVQTNEKGQIIYCTYGEYEEYTDEYLEEYADPETEALVFDIIYSDIGEIEEYMNSGMATMVTNETIKLDGEECPIVVLGTNNEDQFVRELYYAVNTVTRKAYRFDALTDKWSVIK